MTQVLDGCVAARYALGMIDLSMPSDVNTLLDLWPSRLELARDLGVPSVTVRMWAWRGSIPAEHDVAIVNSARMRNLPVTFELLALLRARRSDRPDSS